MMTSDRITDSLAILLLAVVCIAPTRVQAQSVDFVERDRWPTYPRGFAYDIAISGSNAYIAGGGTALIVIDVSDPTNCVAVGGYSADGIYGFDLVERSNYVYVVAGDLTVFDVSNPTNPQMCTEYDTEGYAEDIAIQGPFAYIAEGSTGLEVLSLHDPDHPVQVAHIATTGTAWSVCTDSGYAYVACRSAGIEIFDIGVPTNPVSVSQFATLGDAWDIHVTGGHAYVAARNKGLEVISVTNPANPISVAQCYTNGYAIGVFAEGDYAYLANGSDGLQIVDLSTPAAPVFIPGGDLGNQTGCESARDLIVKEGLAFLANGKAGLKVFDVSEPSDVETIHRYNVSAHSRGTYVSGDYVYVADDSAGFQVIDKSAPHALTFSDNFYSNGCAYDVYAEGDYAYLIGTRGLDVIDIGSPTNVALVGHHSDGSGLDCITFFGVHADGNYAYLAYYQGIQVIDVSNPSDPQLVGTCHTPGYGHDVHAIADTVYLADDTNGLVVINAADPTNPLAVAVCHIPGSAQAVYADLPFVYVATGPYDNPPPDWGMNVTNMMLFVFDATEATNPVEVGSAKIDPGTSGWGWGSGDRFRIAKESNYVHVACASFGLHVFDVACPSNPIPAGVLRTTDANGVSVANSIAYVADGDWGLKAIEVLQWDSDDDGIRDLWELHYFGNTTNASSVTDADGDLFTDIEEFYAGTVPTNPLSLLCVSELTIAPGDNLVLCWQSASNRVYKVVTTTNLYDSFTVVQSNILASPPENCWTTSVDEAASRFFRIDLQRDE